MKKDRSTEVVVGKGLDKKLLSPQQKEFNRLTKKIAEIREQIQRFTDLGQRISQRAAGELQPLITQHQGLRADMVRLLDRMFRQQKFNKTETRKLRHIITDMSFELADAGFDDLKEIFNRHNPDQDFDIAEAEADEITASMMKEMASMMYGIQFDDDADVSTPEKFQAYVAEKIAERDAVQDQSAREAEARRAAKPKTLKQLEAEAKKIAKDEKRKQEEKKITQSVREVYMDLVKAFHPDREPDEAEKVRKTAIMQRVTAAYEDNDLLALLQFQLEFERIDSSHLDSLAADKLHYFNKSLRNQEAELNEALWDIESQLMQMANLGPFDYFNPNQLESKFDKSVKLVKKEIKHLKQDLQSFREPILLKAWLKQYRIQKEPDIFGDLFG